MWKGRQEGEKGNAFFFFAPLPPFLSSSLDKCLRVLGAPPPVSESSCRRLPLAANPGVALLTLLMSK